MIFHQTERKNVAKKGTKYPSREASEVYLTVQTVRILGKIEVSRFKLTKFMTEKASKSL